ncbi:hypothetical protein DD595_25900, partial [Enterobacter cloacae complex sp. 4DZ3-17B2]|uniref:SDR family oxidoreductase n=1 Tax=Enterobacter cloacae complex sp. 4DZ3-17B2 TaxID=2511990 RepID=UPI001027F7FD
EVSIVFNVAATVRFDEKLKIAVAINIAGTKELLELCRQMNSLKVRNECNCFMYGLISMKHIKCLSI